MGFPYRIVVEWSEADEAFVARVPSLPGCVTHGDTEAEAVAEAHVAAEAIVAAMIANRRTAPPPDNDLPSGNIRLRLPRYLHAELARRASLEGVSLNQMMVVLLAASSPTAASVRAPVRQARKPAKPAARTKATRRTAGRHL